MNEYFSICIYQNYSAGTCRTMIAISVSNDSRYSSRLYYSSSLLMLWIISLLIIFFFAWLLLAPLELRIDTRQPVVMMRWKSIGNATIVFDEEEWWLKIRLLFFSKKWNLINLVFAERKERKKKDHRSSKKKQSKRRQALKFFNILRTFQVVRWEVAFSDDDNTMNAYCYWLNFFPLTRQHVHVNFTGENYLVLVIRNQLWRMVHALTK